MITKISLKNVNSFKAPAVLETDKRVNLIYGLNGTGKSTLSEYLYDFRNPTFKDCNIEGLENEDILVYNQKFIEEYFYQPDSLKGIFTLSKENKEVEEKIKIANENIKKFEDEKSKRLLSIGKIKEELAGKKQNAENKTWEIKTTYTGGDRVLEYCLEGLKGQKEKLFNFISELNKPNEKPNRSTDDLKIEVESFEGENAQKYVPISLNNFIGALIETSELFSKVIVGNEDCVASAIIKQLGNSDWVKEGLVYLPPDEALDANVHPCPFCQQKTITKNVVASIKEYYDESYENDLNEIKRMYSDYQVAFNELKIKVQNDDQLVNKESKNEYFSKYDILFKVINKNIANIKSKINTPSKVVVLDESQDYITKLNEYIKNLNIKIHDHNQKIDNRIEALNKIKDEFWLIMRWEYDQTIVNYQNELILCNEKIANLEKENDEIGNNIITQKEMIQNLQRNTVNIEMAINNINNGLVDLGIDGFKIVKHADTLYKIAREDIDVNAFLTLSEGEKMIISFMYFRELCRGKKSSTDTSNRKIIVIDDPISSLSHIYIFNVGHFIKNDFLNSDNYDQVFVLTHSLYFFYELTDINHVRRKENQRLFRMIKNNCGSQILNMSYEEIQNDYHSYWSIIKDEHQAPALIANCMRNIIEYFFNFIEKTDLNNVFQKPELQDAKYQAFVRYINRESHSLGQNIFDLKEFNYKIFKDAFELLFKKSGYEDHYKKMINI